MILLRMVCLDSFQEALGPRPDPLSRNYRSSNGSGGGPCADNQVNAELRVNAYPGLSCVGSNCSTIDPAKQHSSAMVA